MCAVPSVPRRQSSITPDNPRASFASSWFDSHSLVWGLGL